MHVLGNDKLLPLLPLLSPKYQRNPDNQPKEPEIKSHALLTQWDSQSNSMDTIAYRIQNQTLIQRRQRDHPIRMPMWLYDKIKK